MLKSSVGYCPFFFAESKFQAKQDKVKKGVFFLLLTECVVVFAYLTAHTSAGLLAVPDVFFFLVFLPLELDQSCRSFLSLVGLLPPDREDWAL